MSEELSWGATSSPNPSESDRPESESSYVYPDDDVEALADVPHSDSELTDSDSGFDDNFPVPVARPPTPPRSPRKESERPATPSRVDAKQWLADAAEQKRSTGGCIKWWI